jgi:hypothetical protein
MKQRNPRRNPAAAASMKARTTRRDRRDYTYSKVDAAVNFARRSGIRVSDGGSVRQEYHAKTYYDADVSMNNPPGF